MTDTAPVEVTQADRDAAALALGYKSWDDATDYRLSGVAERTRDDLVQAFARHRTASEQSRVGISECDKCGERYPSAPAGVIHKCGACSGGYCSPIRTSQPTPAEGLATQCSGDTQELADELGRLLRAMRESGLSVPGDPAWPIERDKSESANHQFDAWCRKNADTILSALRATHSPSEVEVEAFKRVIHDECRNHAEATVVAGSFSQGYATAWEDAARILPDRLAALSRPSDKTVELLREMQHAVAGLMSQFDHIGCTCTFPDDTCCAFAMAETRLAKLDAHLGEQESEAPFLHRCPTSLDPSLERPSEEELGQ